MIWRHRRALEALKEILDHRDLKEVNFIDFIDLINDVRSTLIKHYSGWLSETDYLRPLLRIILSHTSVRKDETILGLNGEKLKVDQLIQFGLIRFESLDCDQI